MISILKLSAKLLLALAILPLALTAQTISILVNNVGYEKSSVKRAVVQSDVDISATEVDIFRGTQRVVTVPLGPQLTVDSWSGAGFRYFKVADFTDVTEDGDNYQIRVGSKPSQTFAIGEKILQVKTGADQINFFYQMRHGYHNRPVDGGDDKNLPIFGSDPVRRHDISGGWWDATGDRGKHLSHLAYSNYLTPQQIPMVVWALLHANEVQPDAFDTPTRSEAAWGADYLLRALAPDGYFYMSVFDNWGDGYQHTGGLHGSGTRDPREICAWGTPDGLENSTMDNTFNALGIRTGDYHSAMREGAGVSIASLARAYKAGIFGDSSAARYLAGAERAYAHLTESPSWVKYQDNGRLNIIDYYTGLLAASELYHATDEQKYLTDARRWRDSLLTLQHDDGWFYSGRDANGKLYRPFYHAAEEGFPVVALSRFYQVAATGAEKGALRTAVKKNLSWYYKITYDNTGGKSNPFEYVKMYREVGNSDVGNPSAQDLARGKLATASREQTGGNQGCPSGTCLASNAFDGDLNTRWSSLLEGEGAQNDSQWIAVDLGGIYNINRAVFVWEGAYGADYRIEVSENGTNWTLARLVTGNTTVGRVEHTFDPIKGRHIRMYGLKRGTSYGFSLFSFEVYGEQADVLPPSPYQSRYFIPKNNETGYWWQGENARLASMASAFILGAPVAADAATLWSDTLYHMAVAQLDWILGRNPFNLCMAFGYGPGNNYPDFPAINHLSNIKGGICNGISSARTNEDNIEWMPYGDGDFWRNWRFVEQWLPHNAWYLVAISSLSYRIENPLVPEEVSVRHTENKTLKGKMKIAASKRNIRIDLPFAADGKTEAVVYNMQGKKVFAAAVLEGVKSVSIKMPNNLAHGTYIISIRGLDGKNKIAGKVLIK